MAAASTPNSGTSPHSKPEPGCSKTSPPQRKHPLSKIRGGTSHLYLAVIAAVVLGIAVGLIWPDAGVELKPLGT
ncbi:C4-dicarboxylate transporter DctA, partial [Streptomyces sp. NPDC006476]